MIINITQLFIFHLYNNAVNKQLRDVVRHTVDTPVMQTPTRMMVQRTLMTDNFTVFFLNFHLLIQFCKKCVRETILYILTYETIKNTTPVSFNDEIEEFSSRINKYPKDKIQFLKDGTRNYNQFLECFYQDVINAISKFGHAHSSSLILSKSTDLAINDLLRYNLREDAVIKKQEYDFVGRVLNDHAEGRVDPIDLNISKGFEGNIKNELEAQKNRSRRIFKSLFNEEI